MGYGFACDDPRNRERQDAKIHPERPMAQVEGIQVDLGRHGQLISSVDLRPARDAGFDPVPCEISIDGILIELNQPADDH